MKIACKMLIDPKWVPGGHFGESFTVRPCKAERKVLRKRKRIKPSEWAERHRVLGNESALPGPWRNDTAPYVTGLLDAAYFPGVREVDWCAAPQVGKTEGVNTLLGYSIDRDPGPVMLVYPDRDTAKHNLTTRIRKGLIEPSPRLVSFVTGVEDDFSSYRINLQHMSIYTAWSGSASSLSNKPVKTIIFDEVDKYSKVSSKKETGPIPLGEKRLRTYKWSSKNFKISSPTVSTGEIWQAVLSAQVVFHYYVRCPQCGAYQRMHFKQFRMPEDVRDAERIEAELFGWYECENMGCRWDDHDRDKAVALGEYRDIETGIELFAYLKAHRPRRIGFHTPAWLSRFVTLSEVCAAFLRGTKEHGGSDWKERAKDFKNGYEAEPWEDFQVQRDTDKVDAMCDDRPRLMVPGPVDDVPRVAGLVAGVDTQDKSLPYVIVAYGFGRAEESWRVRTGAALTIPDLEEILWGQTYKDPEGNEHRVELVFWDAMGHRTKEIYSAAIRHRGKMLPIRGRVGINAPLTFSNIEYFPNSKIKIPGGVTLVNIDTKFFKDDLSTAMSVEPGDPGGFHLYNKEEMPHDYSAQMCAEYLDEEKQVWMQPSGKKVDYWDCEVYARAAWYHLGGANRELPKPKRKKPEQMKERPKTQADILSGWRPGWYENR
ncbi:phage terminase large subunit family protein [Pseudodesulfovibrio sp. JC047]|uniref:terminase gpA endonuclease subunit n=1 Tax=Pseudodesulfovibrio sp. JC047 TaxID=2683199 RepID=UPI0013D75121|nr:terminase gpA endonuclease subunit [Pseudodesulfovibrio sp. JC047]NDV20014.1 phage terminase large subunit family protein [Pseudodesulfovibrio sp. JC047]